MKLITALLALTISTAHAEDYANVSELEMKTDVGSVVLTIKECKVANTGHFEYEAYATDGAVIHKGCWNKDHDIVNIWFYDEKPQLVASFKDYYFTPKARL